MLIAQRRSLDDVSAELGALSETYSVGQYVRCVVVGLDKVGNSRRVELSLRPPSRPRVLVLGAKAARAMVQSGEFSLQR